MPVQYQPIPQLEMPNVNILGALAQGQAVQQQQLQEERLRQQMGIAEQSAAIAAAKDARAAEAEDARRVGLELDNAVKYKDQFNAEVSKLNPRAPNFQAGYNALLQKYTPLAPTLMANVPKTHTPESWQAFISSHDDLMKQLSPAKADTVVDGVRGEALFRTDPFTQQRTMVAGSFVPAAKNYTLTKEGLAFDPATGTFKTPTQESPAPARGQAGAFNASENAPVMDIVNQAKPAVARVESGSAQGDYGAVGPDVKRKSGAIDNAYGKYQVMGANIPSWTKQALGKSLTIQEFLASPEAQEKVFEDQFARNIKKYGSLEDAVSVWFSGRPLAQAAKAGARDVNMGVQDYVGKVMGGVGKYQTAAAVPLTGENPSLRNVPVNAFTPMAAPVNAMAAPPVNIAPGLGQPQPQAAPMTYAEAAKAPLKQKNTQVFGELLTAAQAMEDANILPKLKGEKPFQRAKKIGEALLPSSVQRTIDPEAERLRTGFTNIIDQYINSLRSSGELTAGEANTVKELEAKKAMLGSADMTIDEIRDIVRSLDKNLGTGELGKSVPVIVNVPGHGPVSFPNQAAADAFKREAGL